MGTFERVAEEVVRGLTDFARAVAASDRALTEYVARLGWSLPSVPGSLRHLNGSIQACVTSVGRLDARRRELVAGAGSQAQVVLAGAQLAEKLSTFAEDVAGVSSGLRTELGAAYCDATGIDTDFGRRLTDDALCGWLEARSYPFYLVARVVGVVEETRESANPAKYQPEFLRRKVWWDRLGRLLSDPGSVLRDAYGWGTSSIDTSRLFAAIRDLCLAVHVPLRFAYPDPTIYESVVGSTPVSPPARGIQVPIVGGDLFAINLSIFAPSAAAPAPQPVALALDAAIDIDTTFTYGIWTVVDLKIDTKATAGLALVVSPGVAPVLIKDVTGSATLVPAGQVIVRLRYSETDSQQLTTLLSAAGFSVGLKEAYLEIGVEKGERYEAFVGTGIVGGSLQLVRPEGDGFLGSLIPEGGLRVNFDLGARWSTLTGFHFEGSAGLEARIPAHVTVGAVGLTEVQAGLSIHGQTVQVLATGSIAASLGPIMVMLERAGLQATVELAAGNVGPVDLQVAYEPPTGAGVTIDAGALTGSGFLDFDSTGRYTGALALDASGLALSAIGVLDTKPPTGGYSFAAIISTTFDAVPLGLGFTLNGVGGLIALNRRIDEDALTNALKGPGLADLFFPTDPLAQAGRVVTDMAQYFPVAADRYVFGPAARIGWGKPTLVTADIAILTEFPAPIKVVLLGKVHAALPTVDNPLINLNVDVLGILDFEKKRLEIDARLRDSKVLDFAIEGGLGLRVEWGDQPNFIVSVGGFNPQFAPPPGFLVPDRVRIPIGFDDDPRLDVTGYLALTPNTAQIGARVDLYASADFGLSITGDLGFDALFVFDPFSFTIDIAADVSLKRHGDELAGIHLHGKLSGPSPWHVSGKACLSCWFFDLCVPFDVTFGGDAGGTTPSLDPAVALTAAIADPANWSGDRTPGTFQSVTLAPPSTTGVTLMDPGGQVRLKQTVVPLNRKITKYLGAAPVGGSVRYDVTQVSVGGVTEATTDVKDWFAPDQVDQLTDDERLARGAYEKMTAGVSLTGPETAVGQSLTKTLGYETIIISDTWTRAPQLMSFVPSQVQQLAHLEVGSAASAPRAVTGAAKFAPPLGTPAKVTLADAGYVVASTVTLVQQTGVFSTPKARGDAHAALADYLAANPLVDATTLQVIPAYELAA